MSSALTMIVFGQVFFLGNSSLPKINSLTLADSVPSIDLEQLKLDQSDSQPDVATVLRSDYTYTPGIGSHKVHGKAVNWYRAKLACESEGAELAIINSAAESNVIAKLLAESQPHSGSQDSDYSFIGFNDIYDEGSYKTIHNEPLSETGFYQWASGEPNNGKNQEHCGSVYRDGKLNDAACFLPYGFVCELTSPKQETTKPVVQSQPQPESTPSTLEATTTEESIVPSLPESDYYDSDW